MCWKSYIPPIKQIATKDITCYKIFCSSDVIWNRNPIKFLGIIVWDKYTIKELCSLYRDYTYIPYEINPKVNIFITTGEYWCWYIDKGYHSYKTLDRAKVERDSYEVIVKCIIPKGSTYYINNLDEIVSSNIIVTDKIIN